MMTTIMAATKNFKTNDGRIIVCTVTNENISMKCGIFKATYEHNMVNQMIDLHSKIMTEKSLKEVSKFINESREPEQLSLF